MHRILCISIPYISDKKPVYLLALTLETDVNKEILENLIIVYLFRVENFNFKDCV